MAIGGIQVQSRTWAGDDRAREVLSTPRAADQANFGDVLARVHDDQGTPEQKARKAAEQLIATALIGPVFKGLRESNNAAEPFKPNAAERSFGQMLDTTLAQRMVGSAHWPLVDSVAQKLLKKLDQPGQAAKAAKPSGSTEVKP